MDPIAVIYGIQANYLNMLAIESANPKPTYNLDGQSVDWGTYRASLIKAIQDLNMLVQMFGPLEVRSTVI